MTKRRLGAIDPDHQAALIVAALATWLAAAPGRRVTLSRHGKGFRVDLDEQRSVSGKTLQDAAAQAATALTVDDGSNV